METKIYGCSDDLIEIEGAITEEFNHYSDEPALLGFSDGTLLEVQYDSDGLWRIRRLAPGTYCFEHKPGSVADDVGDVAIIHGALRWCLYGTRDQINPVIARPASEGSTTG